MMRLIPGDLLGIQSEPEGITSSVSPEPFHIYASVSFGLPPRCTGPRSNVG